MDFPFVDGFSVMGFALFRGRLFGSRLLKWLGMGAFGQNSEERKTDCHFCRVILH